MWIRVHITAFGVHGHIRASFWRHTCHGFSRVYELAFIGVSLVSVTSDIVVNHARVLVLSLRFTVTETETRLVKAVSSSLDTLLRC